MVFQKDNTINIGRIHSELSKRKIGEANKKAMIGNTNMLDKHHSDITKKKMSEAQKGEKSNRFGKHLSEADRRKLTESWKGQKHSDASKKKMSEGSIKYWDKFDKVERFKKLENATIASQRANPSSIEKIVCKVLDSLEIEYKTQVSLECHAFVVDIFIESKNLIIEVNGDYYHNYEIFPKKKIRDNKLQEYCNQNNYKLLWLWEKDIHIDAEKLVKNGLLNI